MPAAPAKNAPAKRETLATAPAGEGKKKREKKPKVKRVAWGERDEKGALKTKIKGKDVGDYNPKLNLPLRRGDFENPSDYYELTADRLEAKVAQLRKQATEEKSLGSVADRKKAKRFKSLFEKFNEMSAELKEAGMSEEQIKAILNPTAPAPAAG